MNKTIETLKTINKQLKKINQMLSEKVYIGAGITVDFCIGEKLMDNPDYIEDIQIGIISGKEEEFLNLMKEVTELRKKYYLSSLEKESEEIIKYLKELK